MIVLAVTWIAKSGREEEAAALFRTLTELSRKEPGCLMYQVHRSQKDRGRFLIYEQYRNEAALDLHRNSPHFLEYARNQLPKIAERKEGELYDPL
jgi:(4S)-4-hydroxy-5-phosphonooxypentane-2,3-dione isomerase